MVGEGIDGVDCTEGGFESSAGGVGGRKGGVNGGGLAFPSCGEAGRLEPLILEKDALDKTEVVDPVSDPVGGMEALLSVLEIVDEALLKSALAGDVVSVGTGRSGGFGDSANGIPGILMSLRTTMSERCKRFRASLFET